MAAPITVTVAPIKISSVAAKPYLITNLGNVPIYLGQDSNVSANNYAVILGVGQGLNWQEINTEVWATTANSSKSTTVNIAYEAAGVFSSTVEANVGNTPQLIYQGTYSTVAGSNTLPDIDISAYSSVLVSISTNVITVGTALSLANQAYLSFQGLQADTPLTTAQILSGKFAPSTRATWTYGDGIGATTGLMFGIQSIQFPVIANYLTGSIFVVTKGLSTASTTATISVYGSYEKITGDRYRNYPGTAGALALDGLVFPVNGASSVIAAPNSTAVLLGTKNGVVEVATSSGSATLTQVAYNLFYWNPVNLTFELLSRKLQASPGVVFSSDQTTYILPNAPIQLQPVLTGAGNATITAIQPT